MPVWPKLTRLLLGDDPKLRRLLGYWAATCAFYLICIGMLWMQDLAGTAIHHIAVRLAAVGALGLVSFYFLVRASTRLGIAPWQLAFLQALFAVLCNTGAYAATGPIRGASLMILLVVVVFCTFALRPRQTLVLCAIALVSVGATMLSMTTADPLRYPPLIEAMHFALVAVSLLAVALLTGEMSKLRARLKQQKEELLEALATIRKLATIDELTSLANRRHMNEVLHAQERRSALAGDGVCIALLDIDFFKNVNDRYGHAVGDAVLRTFADAARAALRTRDVLARWGGEEFLLMLPDTGIDEAQVVLRRVAEEVAAMHVAGLAPDVQVTFSGGLAARSGTEPFADTITRADKAMYVAKSSGRNQVVRA